MQQGNRFALVLKAYQAALVFLVILAWYAARPVRSRAEVSRNGQRRLIWLLSVEAKFKYVYECGFSSFFSPCFLCLCNFVSWQFPYC